VRHSTSIPATPSSKTCALAFLNAYERCLADTTVLFDGMAELLTTLEDQAKHRLGRGHQQATPLHRAGDAGPRTWSSARLTLISGDTTAHAKPHPLPLLTACEQIGRGNPQARVLYVGDDLRDIQAAQAAGMPSAAAAWGYIGHSGEIGTWGASVIVAQPTRPAAAPGALSPTPARFSKQLVRP
jgi:phosphoglycolate phosphatase-like HAD superfamily hydrolase